MPLVDLPIKLFTGTINCKYDKPQDLGEEWTYSKILLDECLKPSPRIPYLKTSVEKKNHPSQIEIREYDIELYTKKNPKSHCFKQAIDCILYVNMEELSPEIREIYLDMLIKKNGKNKKRKIPLDHIEVPLKFFPSTFKLQIVSLKFEDGRDGRYFAHLFREYLTEQISNYLGEKIPMIDIVEFYSIIQNYSTQIPFPEIPHTTIKLNVNKIAETMKELYLYDLKKGYLEVEEAQKLTNKKLNIKTPDKLLAPCTLSGVDSISIESGCLIYLCIPRILNKVIEMAKGILPDNQRFKVKVFSKTGKINIFTAGDAIAAGFSILPLTRAIEHLGEEAFIYLMEETEDEEESEDIEEIFDDFD